ncbi:MAG: GlmU family protein [Deltaproteobacteria bacterium]
MLQSLIFFDSSVWTELLPITFTRPVSKLRIGILSIEEKWKYLMPGDYSFSTQPYLQKKYKLNLTEDNIFINGSVIPDINLIDKIVGLNPNSALMSNDTIIAVRIKSSYKEIIDKIFNSHNISGLNIINISNINKLEHLWDIYQKAGQETINDFQLITKGKKSGKISETNTIIGNKNDIFIADGAKVEASVINSSTGPVYIDHDSEIMEGCTIRGPFYLGKHSTLKMGAKIYGATSIGHHCKVGGEVNNSVFLDFSNKAHDGFIGNSVIGEWCNLGADTNNSNLKNNYAKVKLWSYRSLSFENTGEQFCGLFMGDHSKAGINSMFNTGTVVGVSANIFGPGFPRNFIPSFSWGGNHGFITFEIEKALETAEIMMKRRNLELDDTEKEILRQIFLQSSKNRIWEKNK